MHIGITSLLLLSLVSGEGVELSAVREFRNNRLESAYLLLHLLRDRSRTRRERRSAFRAEKVRISYLGGRIAIRLRKYRDAVDWLRPIYKKYRKSSSIGDYIAHHLSRAYLLNQQPKEAARVLQWMIKNLNYKWRRKARRKLIVALGQARMWREQAALLKRVLRWPAKYGGRKWVWWKRLEALAQAGNIKVAAKGMQRFLLYYPKGAYAERARARLKGWERQKLYAFRPLRWSQRRFQLSRMAKQHPKQAILEAPLWWKGLSKSRRRERHNLASYRLMMTLAYIKAERLKDSIPLLLRVLSDRRSPKYARRLAIRRLGKVYRDLGMYKEGEKALQRYARRHPEYYRTSSWASYNAAWMALYQKKYKRAFQLFGQYLRVYGHVGRKRRWRVRWFRAWCQLKRRKYRDAIRRFKRLGRVAPYSTDRRRCQYWVARTFELQKKWRKSRRRLARLAKSSPLSYYGLMAQQRLYRLEVLLPRQGKGVKCRKCKRSKRRSRWASGVDKSSFAKTFKFAGRPWSDMVVHTLSAKDPAWNVTPAVQKNIQKAAAEASQPAIFPSMPKRCKRSRWYACKAWRRARLLSELGLNRDAARELFRGRRAIRRSWSKLLSSIRWLRSVGAYHEAVRISYYLPGPSRRRGLSQATYLKIMFPPAFSKHLLKFAKQAGISPAFAWSIMREESLYSPMATSHVGAKGLMQVINYTGRRIAKHLKVKPFHPLDLYQPIQSIRFGTWYLGQLTRKFGGHMLLAAAGYNAGPHRIAVWLQNRKHLSFDEFVEELFFTETRVYVKRIFRTFASYSFLYLRRLPKAPRTVAIQVKNNIDF